MTDFLIVDDEPLHSFALAAYLTPAGVAESVTSVSEALHALSGHQFTAVFVDYRLDGETGLDLVRVMRTIDLVTPVILVTGFADLQAASEFCRLGGSAILQKPFGEDELLSVLHEQLQRKELLLGHASRLTNSDDQFLIERADAIHNAIAGLRDFLRVINRRIEEKQRSRLGSVRLAPVESLRGGETKVVQKALFVVGGEDPEESN